MKKEDQFRIDFIEILKTMNLADFSVKIDCDIYAELFCTSVVTNSFVP